jgi:hypothetical protein
MTLPTFDVQAALGFLTSQTASIETDVWAKTYPEIQYPSLIPVDTSANPWATSVSYYSMEQVGAAKFMNGSAQDVPYVDVSRAQHTAPVLMAGIGYEYTIEELGQAQMLGRGLTTERAEAARLAYEQFVERTAFYGDSAVGFGGLLNNADVMVADAADGSGGTADWPTKTPMEILFDMNDAMATVHQDSNTVEMADTVLLPVDSYNYIATLLLSPESGKSVLDAFMEANVYTARTGQKPTVRAVNGLDMAGASGERRMIVYKRDPAVVKLHVPMPLRFEAPQQNGFAFKVPGLFRLGGLEVRRPGAMRYVDGI